jgi:hypothetical protein
MIYLMLRAPTVDPGQERDKETNFCVLPIYINHV